MEVPAPNLALWEASGLAGALGEASHLSACDFRVAQVTPTGLEGVRWGHSLATTRG